jgi:hypothetical protein
LKSDGYNLAQSSRQSSFAREVIVLKTLSLLLLSVSSLSAFGQAPTPKYQRGTITAVSAHQNAPSEPASDVARYDVSVKIGNTLYVVLYTPRNGANSVEYSPGIDMLFSVGDDALTFNSKLSGTTEAPILRREILPAESKLDPSKAPGQYFSMKSEHLSEALDLSVDQLAQIKPTLEQETAEVGQFMWDPALSGKNKLERYQKLVRSSDAKIKPFLSPTQTEKLLELRKQQKKDLQRFIAEQRLDKHY